MIRRIIALVAIVLGIATIGAAVASATVWKPPTTVTVPIAEAPTVNYVVTKPGVLNIVNDTVKVRAVGENEQTPVIIAMGRTDEVQAWVAPSDHWEITGLTSWEELTVSPVEAVAPDTDDDVEDADGDEDNDDEGDVNPAQSDMWVEEVHGVGEATYTWEEIPGQWSMLIASDGAHPAPSVEFTWDREVPTPALVPGIIVGSLLTIIGIALLAADIVARRKRRDDEVTVSRELPSSSTDVDESPAELATTESIMAGIDASVEEPSTPTEFIPPLTSELETVPYPHLQEIPETDRPLTRREIRERERAAERAALLGSVDSADSEPAQWPTQETPIVGGDEHPSTAEAMEPDQTSARSERRERRRPWWRRKRNEPVPPPTPEYVVDEETGEIILTGEIDLSSLTPQASGASWRATWGLDKETSTGWLPVIVPEPQSESPPDQTIPNDVHDDGED